MVRRVFFTLSVVLPLAIFITSQVWHTALYALVVVAPLLLLGWHDVLQRKHSLLRIYPVIGHGRYLMEELRPEIQQYFVESNVDGMPFNREKRSVIYQRAKGELDTVPFGTQLNVDAPGYEWMSHSMAPVTAPAEQPRIRIGAATCKHPYDASHLNISAMSFGALSKNAVEALNAGAKEGGFAHNTGEGGLSPYHLKHGGDVIWQLGTGYFGARADDGNFSPERFCDRVSHPSVKMIEVKISQGAKPGHGGILPAGKVTREIADIRGVPMGLDVISPPAHRAFHSPIGLLEFVTKLREFADGKPIGVKLCVGYHEDFLGICKAMHETGLHPDYIVIDGGEGGTGAAPLELSNSVGMPLRDGLVFAHSALRGVGVRHKLRLIASGKIAGGFDLFRAEALGADLCFAARAMMFALGCIQARRCNDNSCPTGVATQDPARSQALDVTEKKKRVAHFHHETIKSFMELYSAAGLRSPEDIRPHHVHRRIDAFHVNTFEELYPVLEENILLSEPPLAWRRWWDRARADAFV